MLVDSVMSRRVASLDASATAREAARAMRDRAVGSVVVTRDGAAVGIFTERDLARRVVAEGRDPDALRLGDVMSAPLATVEPTAPLEEAAAAMKRLRVKRLVVVLDDEVRGVVSATDLAHALPRLAPEFLETWVKRRWED